MTLTTSTRLFFLSLYPFITMATQWTIDRYHSEIGFSVKHLMIATVRGKFESFTADVTADAADFSDASIRFSAEVASINTGIEARDNHLRSEDFFAAEQHPELSFHSTSIAAKGDGTLAVTGDLTMRGVTKTVTFTAEFGGTMVDPYGATKAGFDITGKISRSEFGLTWNAATEAGGVVVSDEVKLSMSVQLQKA